MCRKDSSTPMLVDPSQETPHVHGEDRTNASAGTARRGFQKHPHVRGEDCRISSPRLNGGETPPRAWGRPFITKPLLLDEGNTPTCVGKTRQDLHSLSPLRKHPHVRGEDPLTLSAPPCLVETPPRAWGRHRCPGRSHGGCRNTPTCVGKTGYINNGKPGAGKHPHVRGEDRR
ncbi:Domain of uncharacterised function (DUF2825) [Klebsiella pneumoniae]|nr:Domain of uncharacterised function (DUF2825) [Klebsiella pneumoniae]